MDNLIKRGAWFFFLCSFIFLYLGGHAYPQQRIEDFYISNFKEDGTYDWQVEGNEAIIYDKYIDIDKMKAKYLRERDTIFLTSDKAKMDKESMDVYLKGNVHIENKEGMMLDTDSLTWQRQKNYIETDDWVKVAKGAMQIEAEGLSADTEIRKADFKKNVEIIFVDEKTKEVTTVTCKGLLHAEYDLGKAVFNDDVIVINPQGKLFSDRLTLFFDTEIKEIVKIVSVRKGREEGKPHLIYFTGEDFGKN